LKGVIDDKYLETLTGDDLLYGKYIKQQSVKKVGEKTFEYNGHGTIDDVPYDKHCLKSLINPNKPSVKR
jgi:hypothetical protein